jgi:hypothetical protein
VRYAIGVTTKRSKPNASPDRPDSPDSPVTGVASGNLGTAANLEDTQVLRIADLEAAAPGWLEAESSPPQPGSIPPEELALLQPAPTSTARGQRALARTAAAPAHEAPSPARPAAAPARPGPATPAGHRPHRGALALAGGIALLVLLLIGGSGVISQLDLGAAAKPSLAGVAPGAAPSPTQAPNQQAGDGGGAGDRGKCHGHGNGNNCNEH